MERPSQQFAAFASRQFQASANQLNNAPVRRDDSHHPSPARRIRNQNRNGRLEQTAQLARVGIFGKNRRERGTQFRRDPQSQTSAIGAAFHREFGQTRHQFDWRLGCGRIKNVRMPDQGEQGRLRIQRPAIGGEFFQQTRDLGIRIGQ